MNITHLFYIIVLPALVSCSAHVHDETAHPAKSTELARLTAAQLKANDVALGPVMRRAMPHVVHCTGLVEVHPQNRADIMPPLQGFVRVIHVVEGQPVTQGQPLVELTHPDFITLQEQYLKTVSELGFVEKEYARQKTLVAEQAAAVKAFERLAADRDALRVQQSAQIARLTAAGLDVRNLTSENMADKVVLRAPFAGYVASVTAHSGQLAPPDQALMTLINLEHKHAELKVFESDVAALRVGSRIVLRGRGGPPEEAYVKLIGQTVDPASRTLNVHGHLLNDQSYLRPGMFVDADLFIGADSVDAVPESALVRNDTSYYVFAPEAGDAFRKVPVKLLTVQDGFAGVRFAGARPQQIAVRGANYLESALRGIDAHAGHAH